WSNSQTTSINNGLTAGVYGIYVTDSNNCMILDGTGVDQPGEINAVLTKHNATDIGLTNGWANLDVSGGTPPYTYLWTNDSTNSSCNSLGAGTYFVMITDAGLCTEWINFEILDDPSLTIYGCDDPQALNFNPLANTNDSSCVYIDNPPDWQYGYSGISHTILLPSASQITISETAIEPGDYIGLFYDSLGSLACAGYVMWLNDNPNIIAWGNTGTLVSPNGFAIGEVFQWKIWDASDSIEYDAGAVYDLTGYPNVAYYFNNGVSSISNLTAISSQTQDILLEYNWSNFSTYIEPFEPDIEDVFLDIISNVNVVKDGSGNIYWPQYGVNNIGSIEIGQGYKIKMDITQVLSITGIAISPEEIEIPLPLNWSILGYLRQTPASIEYLLYSIVQNIQVVKNGSGVIYWPQYGVNNIGNMISGDGYDIKMNFVDTLVYSANFTNVPLSSSKSSVTTSKQELIKITDKNMTLGIPLSSWDILPEYGDEINVYSETGLIIGSAPFVRENTAITIWGNDELSHEKDGLVDNENFTIRIESAKGKNVILNVEYWIEGDQTYSDNGISIIGKIMTNNTIQSDFTLSQNTPNPFNTNTKIEFSIPNPQYVNISIYNELGELVAEPVNREFSNGTHIIEFDGSGFSAGMYYYTLKAGDFIKSYKMTKIK
ncbi:MAG: T9SS type A sorting domain-containing protein, partial [Bacteroidota bacterium]|nr:T9SS type A sorting domain-containing protein [Bacteroidota bacterium]